MLTIHDLTMVDLGDHFMIVIQTRNIMCVCVSCVCVCARARVPVPCEERPDVKADASVQFSSVQFSRSVVSDSL